MGLRSGKMGNQGTYGARIGDDPDREKGRYRGWFSARLQGVKRRLTLYRIFPDRAGKIYGNIFKSFLKNFWSQ
jgi:hypothetical protein